MANKFCSIRVIPTLEKTDKYNTYDYINHINQIMKLFDEMIEDKEILAEQLSRKDQEIQDLLHVIENFSFSASEGYLLSKRIKKARIERRYIKNKLQQHNCLEKLISMYREQIKQSFNSTITKLSNMQRNQENARYRIRQLDELSRFNQIGNAQKQRAKDLADR